MSLTVRDIMNPQLLYVSEGDVSEGDAADVVVDHGGRAVGVVSALDFVRALSGLPPRHPPRFDVDCSSAAAFPDDDPDDHDSGT